MKPEPGLDPRLKTAVGKKREDASWSDKARAGVLALHAQDRGSIPAIPYSVPRSPPGVTSEYESGVTPEQLTVQPSPKN